MQEILSGHLTSLRHWHAGKPQNALAIHCSLAHAGAWSNLAAALPELAITAPDLPGHGHSAAWDGQELLHDVATAAGHDLLGRLCALQDGPVDLLGHSFGATVALRLALEAPQFVRRLVLIEPVLFSIALDSSEFAEFSAGYRAVDALIDRDPEQAAALFHGAWGYGSYGHLPAPQQRYMADRMPLIRAQNPVLLEDRPGLIAPGRLESFVAPVLLLEGGKSPAIIPVIQSRLAARLPCARREIIAPAAHMLPLTHAARCAACIGDFQTG